MGGWGSLSEAGRVGRTQPSRVGKGKVQGHEVKKSLVYVQEVSVAPVQ